jgi:hypothetical protein
MTAKALATGARIGASASCGGGGGGGGTMRGREPCNKPISGMRTGAVRPDVHDQVVERH